MDRQEERDERLATLQAELDQLRSELKDLREALATQSRRPAGPGTTMRALLECPHCETRRLYHIKRVLDRGDSNSEHHFSVTTKGFWSPKPIGRFSCWVCAGCGYTEWYVTDPQTLEIDEQTIELVDIGEGESGPYR